jgi:hypothetical protein
MNMKRLLQGIVLMTALGLVGDVMSPLGSIPWTLSASIAHGQVPPPPAPAAPPAPAPVPPAAPAATAPTPGAAAGPIASADGQSPDVHLEVMQLKRGSGGTVTLRFRVINGGKDNLGIYGLMSGKESPSVDGVHLLDAANKKKYLVVRDSEGNCVCSRGLDSPIKPGESMNFWSKFPAPPDTVEKISVVVPHFEPMDDVPISR